MAGRLRFFTCLGFLMLAPAVSTAQTREAEDTVTVQGTVAAVDHSARTVTIRSQQGTVTTLDVTPECHAVRPGQGWRSRDGHLLRPHQRAG